MYMYVCVRVCARTHTHSHTHKHIPCTRTKQIGVCVYRVWLIYLFIDVCVVNEFLYFAEMRTENPFECDLWSPIMSFKQTSEVSRILLLVDF